MNLPTHYPNDPPTPSHVPAHDTQDNILQDHTKAISDSERASFVELLKPLLEQNYEIPMGSFCNLPDAVVELPLRDPHHPSLYKRQRPLPAVVHPQVQLIIDRWLATGLIKEAPKNTSVNNIIFPKMVRDEHTNQKTTQVERMLLDCRAVNDQIQSDKFLLPNIKELFTLTGRFKILSKIDLRKGFNQFRIKEDHKPSSAFTWLNKQYVSNGAPLGFKPVPSVFQRVMSNLLGDLPFVFVFVDDIIIFSMTPDEHLEHVKTV